MVLSSQKPNPTSSALHLLPRRIYNQDRCFPPPRSGPFYSAMASLPNAVQTLRHELSQRHPKRAVLQILKLAREHPTSGYISGGDCLELLFESKYAAVGKQALLLAHHMNQFNPCQGDAG
jgi:hypothetical protein